MKILALSRIILAFLSVFCLAACSTPNEEFRHSDFLGDYSGFKPLKKVRGATGYAKSDLDLTGYDGIMVDPVTLMIDRQVEPTASAADLEYLSEEFHQALVAELGKSFEIVDRPGPGVLHLRTALTDVTLADTVGMVSDPRGTGHKPRLAPPGEEPEIDVPVSHASMEMELLDSSTGERLAAIVDRKGQALTTDVSPRQTMKAVFDYWATSVEDILASLRSGRKR